MNFKKIKSSYTCERCNKEEYIFILASYPDLKPNLCDECSLIISKKNKDDYFEARLSELVKASGIPDKYKVSAPPIMEKFGQESLIKWLTSCKDQSVYFGGFNGIGKTHISCYSALKLIREYLIAVRYYFLPEWLEEITALKMESLQLYNQAIKKIINYDLIIFDDIGKGKMSESKASTLLMIINKREVENKTIWFTSNFSIDETCASLGENYGNAVKARLMRLVEGNIIK